MERAERSLASAAGKVARQSLPGADGDPVSAMVALREAPIEMAASVAVVRTTSETMKRLLDTFA